LFNHSKKNLRPKSDRLLATARESASEPCITACNDILRQPSIFESDGIIAEDLFDLYWALTLAKPAVSPAKIIGSFQHYLKLEGSVAGRAEFISLLDAHLADRGFCSDMNPLLRVGITYDPQQAGAYVKTKLLSLLPTR
jgi:hypothetical protein